MGLQLLACMLPAHLCTLQPIRTSAVLPSTAHTSDSDQGLSHLLQQSWD